MSTRARHLSLGEIQGALTAHPPILAPKQLAAILQISEKTIYLWIAKGRLNGAFRKRGKHVLLWRDRAVQAIFNSPEWEQENEQR